MRNWLIRTKNNKILGPLSKEKVLDLYNTGDLKDLDEICSGNGYWFWIKEKDLVNKYLLGNDEQTFNPVSEAKTVLCNKSESGSVLGQSVESNTDDTKVIKNPFDKKKSSLTDNPDDDFEYPDDEFIEQVKNTVEQEVVNNKKPLYEEKRTNEADVKTQGISLKTESNDISESDENDEVILPPNDDLDYPTDHEIKKKETDIEKKKRSKRRKRRTQKAPTKRNDVLLLSLIGLILFAIIFIFYTQYSKVFAKKAVQTISIFAQDAHALQNVKKKTKFGSISFKASLLGISISYDNQFNSNKECVEVSSPLDRTHLHLYSFVEPNSFKSTKIKLCDSSELQFKLSEEEKMSKERARKKIIALRNKYLNEVVNYQFSKKSKSNIKSYLYQLRFIEYLINENRVNDALNNLKTLVKIDPLFLSVELTNIVGEETKTTVKNEILKIAKNVVEDDRLPLKIRYIFLLSMNKLEDRDLKRILVDFKSRYSSSKYSFSKHSYKYFTSYLVLWLDSDHFNFNRIEESRQFLESPQSVLMSYFDLPILKYHFKTDTLKTLKVKEFATGRMSKLEFLKLNGLFQSIQNLRFKQELAKFDENFSRPLYLLKKTIFEDRIYTDYHGVYMMIELLNIGAYDIDNLWWFYEI